MAFDLKGGRSAICAGTQSALKAACRRNRSDFVTYDERLIIGLELTLSTNARLSI
jgi:hypothetical protein